jgi:hypothetical protein
MSFKEIFEYFMDTLGKESLSYSAVKIELLNLRGVGRAMEMMRVIGDKRRRHQQRNCRSCARSGHVRQKARPAKTCEGETCEALLEKWV